MSVKILGTGSFLPEKSVSNDDLSKVMDTENDLSVGDMVAFTNDYGVIFGPCEVLAFGNLCNSGRCVYIDSDSYWFPNRPDQLTIIRGAE